MKSYQWQAKQKKEEKKKKRRNGVKPPPGEPALQHPLREREKERAPPMKG